MRLQTRIPEEFCFGVLVVGWGVMYGGYTWGATLGPPVRVKFPCQRREPQGDFLLTCGIHLASYVLCRVNTSS
jgi:hypothetical protein